MTRSRLGRTAAAGCFAALFCLAAGGAAQAQMNITTYHYDNLRTGWNPNETTLTQGNVSNSTFGVLETVSLDDQVDAQPLIVNNETINGGQHNVVYVATENNSVYAIDAQSGQVLLQTNLGTSVPYSDLPGGCNNNGPEVGINSTPVIDTSTGTLYVIALNLQSKGKIVYFLHALSLTTLADTVTPVQITASGRLSNGATYDFDAGVSRQRAGLLLSNGTLYAGFASFCDISANLSRGWVLGWQESTLAPLASNKLNNTLASSPDDFFLSSVWMSGYGLAANSSGSVYFVTGNSDYSGTTYNKKTNIAESAAEMSSDLSTKLGLFTAPDHSQLDEEDGDFGSGGLMLLPPQPGKFPDLAAAAGKDGNLYLLDADKLHKQIGEYQIGGCWCGPSYYQDSDGLGRVVTSGNTSVIVWAVEGKHTPSLVRKTQFNGITDGQDPGFLTSVSSNGTNAGTAIVWAVGRPTNDDPADVDLYAINPDTGKQLFSETAGAWPNVNGNANLVPVVDNGLVYVATDQMLTIFGPGGSAKVHLPNIRHVDARKALAPGEHEIYAIMRGIKGADITATKRSGELVRIDATLARRSSHFAAPALGHALIAQGTFDRSGVLQAEAILHAKDHSALWPSDR
ncbi:MAG TPA: hypothetical protein VHX61_08710 [Rhizomicrobium sp.]|jgi:hypothetical protein|nr:hypothetical protein [Rhizomicrobium sp.]